MNEEFIYRKAAQYGIKPQHFPTEADFVRAVEREWDQEIQREARQAMARAKAEEETNRRLGVIDWGHAFGSERKCEKCGLSLRDYHAKRPTHRKAPDDLCPGPRP